MRRALTGRLPSAVRPTARLTAVLAAGLCACGCTGGSDNSLARVVARGNGICSSTVQRVQALGPAPRFTQATAANLAAAQTYLGAIVPVLTDLAAQLRALGDPDADASKVHAMLGRLDATLTGFEAAESAATRGDLNGFRSGFGAAVAADEAASAIDEQLGLTLCEQIATQPFRRVGSGSPSASGTPTP